MQPELAEMQRLLAESDALLRQAVALGAQARAAGPTARRAVDDAWEQFMAGLVHHLKETGRQHGVNLLAGISFSRILARLR